MFSHKHVANILITAYFNHTQAMFEASNFMLTEHPFRSHRKFYQRKKIFRCRQVGIYSDQADEWVRPEARFKLGLLSRNMKKKKSPKAIKQKNINLRCNKHKILPFKEKRSPNKEQKLAMEHFPDYCYPCNEFVLCSRQTACIVFSLGLQHVCASQ